MTVTASAIAILVAGGTGSRFGALTPKQFLPLGGKPLLAHALAHFDGCRAVRRIVLVLPREGFIESCRIMEPFLDQKPVNFVPGGETRQASTWEGLSAVDATYDGIVAVHDGARPCADGELIERVVTAAVEHKAAIAAVPVVETLKALADENTIRETVDRGAFCRAQTPQCFQHGLLRRAFESAQSDGFVGTDEAALVERLDVAVRVVLGSERNIKVTTPEDFARVEYFLERGTA